MRLNTLSPSFSEGRGSRTQIREGEAILVIRGQAKNSEVVLEFVDALFAHPKFRAPDLSSESLQDSGLLDFGLSVIYHAGSREPEQVEESAEAAEAAEATETGEAAAVEESTGESDGPPAPAPDAPAEVVSE